MRRTLFALAAFSALITGAAWAEPQNYAVALGGRQLGTLQFNGQSRNAAFLLSLNNAPFGIKNGTFNAATQSAGSEVNYLGSNRGSETRDIVIARTAGQVTSVEITPSSEMTQLSEAKAVPAGVLFPPELFAALANADRKSTRQSERCLGALRYVLPRCHGAGLCLSLLPQVLRNGPRLYRWQACQSIPKWRRI